MFIFSKYSSLYNLFTKIMHHGVHSIFHWHVYKRNSAAVTIISRKFRRSIFTSKRCNIWVWYLCQWWYWDSTGNLHGWQRKLDHVSHMNLVSECSVGMINYELSIRGKSHLNTASRMTVLNKNEDIIRKCPIDYLSKYCKPAKTIKKIKLQWLEKLRA